MAVRAQSFPPSGSISGSYFSISSWFFKRDLSERNDNGLSMACNYATFLHNFLGIICIKTHGCKCTICCCAEASWSDPLLKLPSVVTFPGMLLSRHLPTVIRVLIRWIKSKLCDGVRRLCVSLCDGFDWGSQGVQRGTLDWWHQKQHPFSRLFGAVSCLLSFIYFF